MKTSAVARLVIGMSIIVVVVAVAVGLFLAGSPTHERMRRLDEVRVQDLHAIARAVDLYWTRYARLPNSLEVLAREPGASVSARDPESAEPYDYRVLGSAKYELCARFDRDSAEQERSARADFWSHGVGQRCFQLEARALRRPDSP